MKKYSKNISRILYGERLSLKGSILKSSKILIIGITLPENSLPKKDHKDTRTKVRIRLTTTLIFEESVI